MTGTSAVLTPINALMGNLGKPLAGQMGAVGADDGGGELAEFDALFARFADGDAGAEGAVMALLTDGEVPNAEKHETAAATGTGVLMAKPVMTGGGTSVAALALMRLNEALVPEPTPAPLVTEGQPALASELATPTDSEPEDLSPLTESETADGASQMPQEAVAFWQMPGPRTVSVPPTAVDGDGQVQAGMSVPDLLAQLVSAPPELQSGEGIRPQLAAPHPASTQDTAPTNVATQVVNSTPVAYGSAAAVMAQTAPSINATSLPAKATKVTDEGQDCSAPSGDTESVAVPQPATIVTQPPATPQRRGTISAGAVPNQPTQQQAVTPQPASSVSVASGAAEEFPQPLASNLTAAPTGSTGSEHEAACDPVMFTAARIGGVHQETYLGPATQQSLTAQVAERIVDELDTASPRGTASDAPEPQHTAQTVKVLHLQLNPPDLGPLTVRMTLKHEALDLQVEAGKQETAKLIDNDRDTLFGLLRSAGYTVDGLTVQTTARADATVMNSGTGAFPQSSGQAPSGWQQSHGRGSGQASQGDGRGGDTIGGNGKDGSDTGTVRTAGGAVYL